MVMCMIIYQKDVKVSNKKQCSDTSILRVTEYFMDIKCQPSGMFEGLSHP